MSCNVSYFVLYQVLQINSLNSQTCLTPGKLIMKSSFFVLLLYISDTAPDNFFDFVLCVVHHLPTSALSVILNICRTFEVILICKKK
jgi:hypothetical protein